MHLYERMANDFINEILAKNLKPGDKLPTEKELIETYSTSKMTVRRAYQILKDMGIVISIHGSGIYVRDYNNQYLNENKYQASYSLLAILKSYNIKLQDLQVKYRRADFNISNTLNIPVNEPILQIERTRSINGQKIMFEVAYMQLSRIGEFDEKELEESLYLFIANHTKESLLSSSQFYSALIPQEYLRSKLDLDEHEGVFCIEQVTVDSKKRPLIYTKCYQAGNTINI